MNNTTVDVHSEFLPIEKKPMEVRGKKSNMKTAKIVVLTSFKGKKLLV